MSPFPSLLLLVCLVSCGGAVNGAYSRTLKTVFCSADECDAIARRDGEAIRGFVQEGRPSLCECQCDLWGNTLLHGSTVYECVVCADVLLDVCPINPKDDYKNRPIHDVAAICQSPMTNFFLDRGARPNKRNKNGNTPLCLAAKFDSENCGGVVRDLVNKGAKICKRCEGDTPYELAVNQVTKDVLEQLGGDHCH